MRTDGFDRMDVSTSIDDDPKFRTLARRHPEFYAPALCGYVGLLARSWREGERLTAEEGWPSLLPYDVEVANAMGDVGLIDSEGRIPEKAWGAWFGAAAERRRLGRERQHRADLRRGRGGKHAPVDPSDSQGSQDGQTGSTGRQSVSQSGPTPVQRRSNGGPVGSKVPTEGPCRDCGGFLTDREPSRVGPGWIEHVEHPKVGVA